jgi:hypothetical protein
MNHTATAGAPPGHTHVVVKGVGPHGQGPIRPRSQLPTLQVHTSHYNGVAATAFGVLLLGATEEQAGQPRGKHRGGERPQSRPGLLIREGCIQ